MPHPSSFSSKFYSSSYRASLLPPPEDSNKPCSNDVHHDAYDVISEVRRRGGGSRNGAMMGVSKQTKICSLFIVGVTLLSILAVGSVQSDLRKYENKLRGLPRARNRLKTLDSSNDVSDVFAFTSVEPPKRGLEEPMKRDDAIDGGLCDLAYCQETFPETICIQQEPQQSTLASIPIAVQILLLLILLSFSALFSGLTLGLMSLDLTGLEIVMAGDDPDAAKYAEKIYPVRKRGNLLLCTLLLGNTAVNSLMSIFSAEIFNGTIGFVTSTFLILIFGEIIPQALCSRYALRIGSIAVPLVKFIRAVLFVLAYPLAKGLDWALGRELATTYSNAEMIELLNVHVKENIIDQEEANAMTGALTYKNIHVKDAMTAMEQTFMLEVDERLSFETIGKIFKTGYSRIPVYEISRNNVIGLLFVKDLIFLDPEDNVPVRSFIQIFGRNVHLVWPDDTLGEVLAELKKGRSHLAVVRDVNNNDESQDPFYEVKGIITLEDIVERIIGDSIVDETDAFVDSEQRIKADRGDTFEWARLRLLDTKIVDEMLSPSEISAVTAHLRTNHANAFKTLTDVQLTRLVSTTPVSTLPTATQDLNKELPNELMYEKNVPSDTFTLILSGKITIFVGSENFRSDLSSWSVLGSKALEDSTWTPDYSAFVSDGPCRCIQIPRASFIDAYNGSVMERRIAENKAAPALSVASSSEADATTVVDGRNAPNRRKDVLARLFSTSSNLASTEDLDADETIPAAKIDKCSEAEPQVTSQGTTKPAVQFVETDVVSSEAHGDK